MGVDSTAALRKVVDGGYCIGCGGCAAFDERIQMRFDSAQRLQAVLPEHGVSMRAAASCPFADGTANEDEIAQRVFDAAGLKKDARIGPYLANFGGWVEEGDFRASGSSGGIGTWLQVELLDKGLVDAVINVCAVDVDAGDAPLFRFSVARSRDEILANAKTRYYPVEMSGVIRYVLDNPARYAVIAVPCFCRTLRLSSRQSPALAERLVFILGIVCGHMKSAAFADAIAWQSGIHPDEITGIDFRTKLKQRRASRYGATVEGVRGREPMTVTRPMEGLVGANWGHGLFKLKACDFCDDVLAETADAAVGDAWLPAYDEDDKGANVVVARNPVLLNLLHAGAEEGRLKLDPLSADAVAESQAGGLRHRRDGLAYRLWMTDDAGVWRPKKRVRACRDNLAPHMQRIYKLRYELAQRSHVLFQQARAEDDLRLFLDGIRPLIDQYERRMSPSLPRRLMNFLHRKWLGLKRVGQPTIDSVS